MTGDVTLRGASAGLGHVAATSMMPEMSAWRFAIILAAVVLLAATVRTVFPRIGRVLSTAEVLAALEVATTSPLVEAQTAG